MPIRMTTRTIVTSQNSAPFFRAILGSAIAAPLSLTAAERQMNGVPNAQMSDGVTA